MPEKVLEASQYIYYIAPQTAQGSPAAAGLATLAPAVVDGSVSMAVDAGVNRWPTYGNRFYDSVRFVNSLQGEGELQCAAHPETVGRLLKWYLGGSDTVTADGSASKHALGLGAGSQWLTIYRKVGVTEGTGAGAPRLERYNDCRMTQLIIEGSNANKMLRVRPTFLVADPGEIVAAVPTITVPTAPERPFVYTDGTAALKFSTNTGTAVVNPDTISFTLTMTEAINRAEGDDVIPLGFLTGESTVTWAIEATAATAALQEYNKLLYGHHPLVTGDKPQAAIPAAGAIDLLLDYGSGAGLRKLGLVSGALQFTPTGELTTNTGGQASTITFTGEATGATPLAPFVTTGSATAYI
jgi:hypothetical protein